MSKEQQETQEQLIGGESDFQAAKAADFHFDHSDNDSSKLEEEFTKDEQYELPLTIELDRPVQVGKETVLRELVFEKHPNVGMVMNLPAAKLDELKIGHLFPVIAGMTGKPVQQIMKLESNTTEIFNVVVYFLKSSGILG